MSEEITNGLPSAADLDAVEAEKQIAAETGEVEDDELEVEFEPESVFVTREEFDALLERIEKFNIGAPHKL